MIRSLDARLPRLPISSVIFLAGDSPPELNQDDEDDEKNVFPDSVVSVMFSYLPIKDIFRCGCKLSRNWLRIWKENPLVLHDLQLLPDPVKEKIVMGKVYRFDIASSLTRILDMHPGPVDLMRLEYTTWSGDNSQLELWIDKLISKGVMELVLFGRWPQADLDVLPRNIILCDQLVRLYLCFFDIPTLSVDDAFSLTKLKGLSFAHCCLKQSDVTILLSKCHGLRQVTFVHVNTEAFTIMSESISFLALYNCRIGRLQISDCPKMALFVQRNKEDSLHGTEICISSSPNMTLLHLYLDQRLCIDRKQIMFGMPDHPEYPTLTRLCLVGNLLDFDMVCDLLRCFPNLLEFEITRTDPYEPCTAFFDWKEQIKGIGCVEHKMERFSLFNSRLDDSEIELAQSILMYGGSLERFEVEGSSCVPESAIEKLMTKMRNTIPASGSAIHYVLPTEM